MSNFTPESYYTLSKVETEDRTQCNPRREYGAFAM